LYKALVQDVRIRLNRDSYVTLPVTLLATMDEVIVSVRADKNYVGREAVKDQKKRFTVKFDQDGLLVVRGIEGQDRWNPVLTSNTGRWIRRRYADGLTDVQEMDVDQCFEMPV
jgi:hypothetical protein